MTNCRQQKFINSGENTISQPSPHAQGPNVRFSPLSGQSVPNQVLHSAVNESCQLIPRQQSSDYNSNEMFYENSNRRQTQENPTIILADSMTRDIKTSIIKKSTGKNVMIRTFSGATVTDMIDYSKPSLRMSPANVIIHVGTNDMMTDHVNTILQNMTKLCDEIEEICPSATISVSEVILRKDIPNVENKVK